MGLIGIGLTDSMQKGKYIADVDYANPVKSLVCPRSEI